VFNVEYIAPNQKCTPTRQLADNILDIEHKALQFAITEPTLAGIVSFDLRAAFPSLSRAYIFWLLELLLVPPNIIHVIEQLYTDNLHYSMFNKEIFSTILFTSGVKQGCPLSMILFAFALDPIIRLMAFTISPHNAILRGYCDDLCATSNTKWAWSIIIRLVKDIVDSSVQHVGIGQDIRRKKTTNKWKVTARWGLSWNLNIICGGNVYYQWW
jgi:hypothetical protein